MIGTLVPCPLPAKRQRRVGHWINPVTGCWEWRGMIRPDGYGIVQVNNEAIYAHRAYYELFVGPIPPDRELDHLCRCRHCVNPEHLEAVLPAVNSIRGLAGRHWQKLRPEQVDEIRRRHQAGEMQSVLASEYGVHRSTISLIVNRINWWNRP